MKRYLIGLISLLLVVFASADHASDRAEIAALGNLTTAPAIYKADDSFGINQSSEIIETLAPSESAQTLKAVFFDSVDYQGNPTRVYGWVALPQWDQATDPLLPAVVLVHGGGGTAQAVWANLWAERGYVAISIDTEGRSSTEGGVKAGHSMGGPSRTGVFNESDVVIGDQFMFHATAGSVLANSLMRSLPFVDDTKIGIHGISWGGLITSNVIGIDPRFAFAIPSYGCGHMWDGIGKWQEAIATAGGTDYYKNVWDSMLWLENATMPIMWLSWPKENNFNIDSQANSYNKAPGTRMVSLIPGMRHSQVFTWRRADSYDFADSIVGNNSGSTGVSNGNPWCIVKSQSLVGDQIVVEFESTRTLNGASLIYTNEMGSTTFMDWPEVAVDSFSETPPGSGVWQVTATLPADANGWFVNVTADTSIVNTAYLPGETTYFSDTLYASSRLQEVVNVEPPSSVDFALPETQTTVTGNVSVDFTAIHNLEIISVDFLNESHPGAFSTDEQFTFGLISDTPFEVDFDNTVAGIESGESATSTLRLTWVALDNVTTDTIDIPLSAMALGPDKSNDILLVSVGESSGRYSEVAIHLQGILANAEGFNGVEIDIFENANIESLADGFYDRNSEDVALRDKVAEGYRHVILIPTINTTPTATIEYREFGGGPTNVYDDAPFDNEYFAPEVFYEGCTQFSKLILNAGSTPLILLPKNADELVSEFGPVMYRVANGVGMELIPGAYALDAAGVTTQAEDDYLYACSIFTQVTGLSADTATYSPAGISSTDATGFANTAETTVNLHQTTEHYAGSYENEGAVVYRGLDISSAPFNDVVRYMYKGSSTHDWTKDALNLMIDSNASTTAARRKLGIKNGGFSGGTRYWHPDDFATQGSKFSQEPNQASFMYVSGSWAGADAQDTIDLDQENMIPMAFDWIKSFAISPAVSGAASTLDALDYHSCVELYFNYTERGWKLIPLTIGMGRLNEAIPNFVASDDALHASDPLVYMNAYMMLSSALGTEFPLPPITPADIHRGSYTTEQIHEVCLIGHKLIKELAYLSETGEFIPDSDLKIVTDSLPSVPLDQPFNHQLSASGGTGSYTWKVVSSTALPSGLSLSPNGTISGTMTEGDGVLNLAFQVTDSVGAFRKVGLKLGTAAPAGEVDLSTDIVAVASTNYGTDAVAAMYSPVQTAPDGKATYRIAIDVDPMAGTSITSAATTEWGINSGEAPTGWWATFDGSLSQSVDSISNIQVVDFNANGGTLTVEDFKDFSFQSVTILNGHNASDRVKVVAGGVINAAGGLKMTSSPEAIDLQALAGADSVSGFSLANGNVGNTKDRWSVSSIKVNYTISLSSGSGYSNWASGFGLVGDEASETSDASDRDGYPNLLEFALGMNPTLADAGSRESYFTEEDGGSRYFVYEYERRSDYMEQGLSYTLIETPDLLTPSLASPQEVIVANPINGFETVTSRYLIDDRTKFLQLKVEIDSP